MKAFLFIGSDDYTRQHAVEDLISSLLGQSSRQLDVKAFYGGETDIAEVIGHIATIPFTAPKRIAVIRDFERLPKEARARLIDYLKKPSGSACLILEALDDSVVDKSDNLAEYVDIRKLGDLTEDAVCLWVRRFVTSNGKTIEAGALKTVLELQGQGLFSIAQELEKLISFVGDRPDITASDVEEIVGGSLERSAFKLTDAIADKDTERALSVVSDLALSGKRQHEIIGLLCWQLKRMAKALALQASGQTNYSIARTLKVGRDYTTGFFGQLKNFNISQIRSKMEMLLDADLDIKRTAFAPGIILEFAVIRLCL